MRNRIIIAAKVAVSIGVLFSLGRRFEVSQLLTSLHHVEPIYLLVAIALALLTVPVVGNRWRLLAGMLTVQIPFVIATRATFAGLFVGQVLPGAIGADVVRGWMVWNMGGSNKLVIASLVMDRLVSLLAVVIMVVATLPMLMTYLPNQFTVWAEWALLGILICILIGYLSIRVLKLIYTPTSLERLMNRINLKEIRFPVPIVCSSLGLAIAGHSLTILSAFFLGLAIGMDSSLYWMWGLIMPIIILVTAIPISINGWGIREFAMIYLWALFGIEESEAFLISICLGVVAIVSSLPGVWFWLERRVNKSSGLAFDGDSKIFKNESA